MLAARASELAVGWGNGPRSIGSLNRPFATHWGHGILG